MKKIFASILLLVITTIVSGQPIDFKKLKSDVLEAQSQREKALALIALGSSYSPVRQIDSMFIMADSLQSMEEGRDSLYMASASDYMRAFAYYRKGNLDSAEIYFKKAYRYFKDEEKTLAANCLNFMGILKHRTHQPDSAIQIFELLLDQVDAGNLKRRVSAHGNLGMAYRDIGNYAKAIDHFEQSVSLDSTNKFSILNSYLNVASIFSNMNLYEQGIETLNKVEINEMPMMPAVAAYYNNLGHMYYELDRPDSALKFLTKGLQLSQQMEIAPLLIRNRLTMSEIFMKRGEMQKADSLLKEAGRDINKYPAPPSKIDLNIHLASFFLANEMYDSTIFFAKEVLKITRPERFRFAKKNTYQLLGEAYEGLGNAEQAANYFKLYSTFQDSVNDSQKIKFEQDAKARYLVGEKDKELAESQSESDLLKTWQKRFMILIGILVILSIVLFFFLKMSRKKLTEETEKTEGLSKEIEKNKREIIELKSKAVVLVNDIISIKSDGHYLEFYLSTKERPEIDRNRIKEVLEVLPSSKFVQIHRSYIVNIDHIKVKYADKVLLKDGRELPVSRSYKSALNQILGKG